MKLESYLHHRPRVHPDAWGHATAVVIGDVELGAEASLWPNTVLRGDQGAIKIGARTNIQDGSVLHSTHDLSTTTVGEECTVGHGVILHGCTVEDGCLIGMGAIVLDNAVVGAGSLVGAGALVVANMQIPPGSLVLGSPAKVIGPLNDKQRVQVVNGWQTYVKLAKEERRPVERG